MAVVRDEFRQGLAVQEQFVAQQQASGHDQRDEEVDCPKHDDRRQGRPSKRFDDDDLEDADSAGDVRDGGRDPVEQEHAQGPGITVFLLGGIGEQDVEHAGHHQEIGARDGNLRSDSHGGGSGTLRWRTLSMGRRIAQTAK